MVPGQLSVVGEPLFTHFFRVGICFPNLKIFNLSSFFGGFLDLRFLFGGFLSDIVLFWPDAELFLQSSSQIPSFSSSTFYKVSNLITGLPSSFFLAVYISPFFVYTIKWLHITFACIMIPWFLGIKWSVHRILAVFSLPNKSAVGLNLFARIMISTFLKRFTNLIMKGGAACLPFGQEMPCCVNVPRFQCYTHTTLPICTANLTGSSLSWSEMLCITMLFQRE